MSIKFESPDKDLRSAGAGRQLYFSVENKTSNVLELLYFPVQGAAVHYATINSGDSYRQLTFSTHAWWVKSSNPAESFKFVASHAGKITVLDYGKFFDGSSSDEWVKGDWSNHWGFGMPDAALALGVPVGNTKLTETPFNNHKILNALNILAAWEAGYTGKGVIVAVLDEGIFTHSEITVSKRWDVVDGDDDTTPAAGRWQSHGLQVASVIAAKYEPEKANLQAKDMTGVAPDVTLIDVRISNSGASNQRIADGIKYAVSQGAKVIQISQVSSGVVSKIVKDAVKNAYEKGALVVWAGGNTSSSKPEGLASTSLDGISISVGNFNINTWQPFGSSSLGGPNPVPYVFAPSNGWYPNIDGGYQQRVDGGTSLSSPYVSGIAALLFQKYPEASPATIIEKITGSSWIPSIGRDVEFNASFNRLIDIGKLSSIADVGSPAVDMLVAPGASSEFSLEMAGGELKLIEKTTSRTINVTGVDRVKFDNVAIAFDLNGNAGDALELIHALTGNIYLSDRGIVGQVIHMFDTAKHRNDVVAWAVREVFGEGATTNLYDALLRNVYGLESSTELQGLVMDFRNSMRLTNVELVWFAAESAENHSRIDLVGIADKGVEYLIYG